MFWAVPDHFALLHLLQHTEQFHKRSFCSLVDSINFSVTNFFNSTFLRSAFYETSAIRIDVGIWVWNSWSIVCLLHTNMSWKSEIKAIVLYERSSCLLWNAEVDDKWKFSFIIQANLQTRLHLLIEPERAHWPQACRFSGRHEFWGPCFRLSGRTSAGKMKDETLAVYTS